jgi:hypothetical protein
MPYIRCAVYQPDTPETMLISLFDFLPRYHAGSPVRITMQVNFNAPVEDIYIVACHKRAGIIYNYLKFCNVE